MTDFRKFQVGTKVRLTAKFLRSTGQGRSDEARKVWTIQGFSGPDNCWAIIGEPSNPNLYTEAELAADPSLRFRRVALANLCIVGQLDSRDA